MAQALDYARAISRWSYSDLQRQVSQATGRTGNVPFDLAKELIPDLDERRFVDETAAAMRQGRFLLLIAGDGIREDIHAMTELINRNAASGFSFGLVEVALYGLEDGGLAVQPRLVAKTQIIQRNIVVLRDGDHQFLGGEFAPEADLPRIGASPSVTGNPLGESPKQAAYREWWKPVMEAPLDDPDQEPPKLFWPNDAVPAASRRVLTLSAAYPRLSGNETFGGGGAFAAKFKRTARCRNRPPAGHPGKPAETAASRTSCS